jgi:hypothetical protein
MGVQSERTKGKVVGMITSVIRPSDDFRANSIGKNGPSVNQLPRTGKSRESQTSEPHPKHAINIADTPTPEVTASLVSKTKNQLRESCKNSSELSRLNDF